MTTQQPDRSNYALQYIYGEVHALGLFCWALARSHPDRGALLAEMDSAEQQGLAHIEATELSDAAVEGYRYVFDNMRKGIGDLPR